MEVTPSSTTKNLSHRPPTGQFLGLTSPQGVRSCPIGRLWDSSFSDDKAATAMDRMRLTAEKATHEEFTSFCGEVVAVDHLEEVSGLTAQGSGSTWTDVHREVWVRPCRGVERKFTFTNVDIAVRIGHHVTLLLGGERPVAVINFSTEQYVNLVMPRWFELFNAAEAFGFAALLVGAGLTAPAGLVALLMGAGGYGLVKWLMRQRRYRALSVRVEAQIQRTIAQSPAALADHPGHRAAP